MAQYDFSGVFLPAPAAFARRRYNKISLLLTGVFSHGLNRFPRAVEYLHKGEIDPAAEAECTASFGAMERWHCKRSHCKRPLHKMMRNGLFYR